MIMDILRGSVTSYSPQQTKTIFDLITSLPNTKVVKVKNGFADKNGKKFDPAEQADIKVILLIENPDQKYDELMEVQIIQAVNVDIKKIMHKSQDFTRSKNEFIKKVESNKNILDAFNSMIYSRDKKAADIISNSILANLESVKEELKK